MALTSLTSLNSLTSTFAKVEYYHNCIFITKQNLTVYKNHAHVLCELLHFPWRAWKDWAKMIQEAKEIPSEPSLFD